MRSASNQPRTDTASDAIALLVPVHLALERHSAASVVADRVHEVIVLKPGQKATTKLLTPSELLLIAGFIAYARSNLKSIKTLEGHMKRIRKRFGKLRLSDIRQRDIAAWLAQLRDEGPAPATILKTLVTVNRTFVLAARWNLAGAVRNPCVGVPRPRFSNARQTYIDGEQTARLLDVAKSTRAPHLPSTIALLLLTGMRVSELLGTRWQNVDVGRRTLYIPLAKNGRSRTIPLSQAAIATIEQVERIEGSPFLFPNPRDPTKRLTTIKNVSKAGHP